jgi:predicted Zn-ribbon and HTH transcriptional regulator
MIIIVTSALSKIHNFLKLFVDTPLDIGPFFERDQFNVFFPKISKKISNSKKKFEKKFIIRFYEFRKSFYDFNDHKIFNPQKVPICELEKPNYSQIVSNIK